MRTLQYLVAFLGSALLSSCGQETSAQLQSARTQSVDYLSIVVKNLRLPQDRMQKRDTEVCLLFSLVLKGSLPTNKRLWPKAANP